ncbi:lipid II flippase MurJ [Streptomyces reniochalinae]|uniref:Murein biosynthesis protein MurJ n=1 Tax=Streptomyces reniochalinae TaxID=2250578 RepID=A0A367EXE1_9ACTN|nr:lipid II flippase MurJ [Streptomyces reniochalinae]RCG22312.1 murein biosynthesis protein MurJ [Streptomyces reniochalinae]
MTDTTPRHPTVSAASASPSASPLASAGSGGASADAQHATAGSREAPATSRGRPPGEAPALGRFLAWAAAVTAVLTAAGSLFGLLRDQSIARLFGADADTDAFLVAWTIPELASTLLIEDAMALVLVPAFSLALSRRAAACARTDGALPDAPGTDVTLTDDPVRALVAATLPRLSLLLAGAAGLLVVAAPQVVRVLAPGLPDAGTAAACLRLTALTVLTFGLAGYFSAALRAHRHFVAPAAIYVTYNAGIIAVMYAGHGLWGVRAAALGVAVGGALMVLVQLPAFLSRLPARRARPARGQRAVALPAGGAAAAGGTAADGGPAADGGTSARGAAAGGAVGVGLGVVAPVVTFAVSRQAQVLFERFMASSLPAGAISHLNYAQKVAQLPMVLSLMVCTVTFPVVARAMADGEAEVARRRVERDLALAGIVVLLGAAYVVACAPQLIGLLFERGAFDARDTAATAAVMRVYTCGLLGHSMVGALVRPFFSGSRPPWYPAVAMGAGLAVTAVAGVAAAGPWGVYGIAAANALGITTTAALLLRGLGARVVAIDVPRVAAGLLRLLVAAGAAAAAGRLAAGLFPSPLAAAAVGGAAVLAAFAAVGRLVGAPELPNLFATVTRRITHVR